MQKLSNLSELLDPNHVATKVIEEEQQEQSPLSATTPSAPTSAPNSGLSTPFYYQSHNVNINRKNGKLSSRPSFSGTPLIHSRFDEVMHGLKELSLNESERLSHSRLVKTATGVRNLANQLGQASIHMDVKTVLIVTKARDNSLIPLTREVASWIMEEYGMTVYVDSKLKDSKRFGAEGYIKEHPEHRRQLQYWTPEMLAMEGAAELVDLVVTLGGDGTTLYVGRLFQQVVPPVISFSLGSLGFLANYRFENYREVLEQVFDDQISINLRMRFACSLYNAAGQAQGEPHQVVNDIVIDRGPNPWLSMLELFGDNKLLTVVQADGLILSTPTGSTAYSLSAGGALVHPEIPAMCVTPICPHTLSFRPMLLPDSMHLKVQIPNDSRSTAWVSFDGRSRIELTHGDYLTVHASQYPFPTICTGKTEFIDSVSRSFHWNNTQQQKPFSKVEEEEYDIDF